MNTSHVGEKKKSTPKGHKVVKFFNERASVLEMDCIPGSR